MPNQEKETLRDLRLERSLQETDGNTLGLQETDGNTLGSPEKDQKAQDLAEEAKTLIQQAFLETPEGPHIQNTPKKTFKDTIEEQSKDPHGGHIINSEEE
jgi:hypothetical protein